MVKARPTYILRPLIKLSPPPPPPPPPSRARVSIAEAIYRICSWKSTSSLQLEEYQCSWKRTRKSTSKGESARRSPANLDCEYPPHLRYTPDWQLEE